MVAAALSVRGAARATHDIISQVAECGGAVPTADLAMGALLRIAATVPAAARAALNVVPRVAARGGAVAAADV